MDTIINKSQKSLRLYDLGIIDYRKAYHMQCEAVQDVICGKTNTLFLCEHTNVFTLGRLADDNNFRFAQDEIKKAGADIIRIDRGGEVTFHGPWQVVAYPIINLNNVNRDLRLYMNKLEQVAIDLLRYFGIVANRVPGYRGVWVSTEKIASIGIGIRRWVSFHGMSINVNTDLAYFKMIRPCGLDVSMMSMQKIKGKALDIASIKEILIDCFCQVFDFTCTESIK